MVAGIIQATKLSRSRRASLPVAIDNCGTAGLEKCVRVYHKGIPLEERLWGRVAINDETGCWEWTGKSNDKGYGYIRVDSVARRISRVVWEMYRGPIPPGMSVCHHCDNPPCVRFPDHLFLGTTKDNLTDASRKGRLHGILQTRCDIDEATILEIRERYATGRETIRSLARCFEVSSTWIWKVIRHNTWSRLP
jgi:hypothetical protein